MANGLVIFLFRQFLAQIPRDIFEAAKIDGANWVQIYAQIAMPLAWPTIVTASLMLFLKQWDAFFWPLVAASAPEYVVIQVAVARNITYEETHWGTLFSMNAGAAGRAPLGKRGEDGRQLRQMRPSGLRHLRPLRPWPASAGPLPVSVSHPVIITTLRHDRKQVEYEIVLLHALNDGRQDCPDVGRDGRDVPVVQRGVLDGITMRAVT